MAERKFADEEVIKALEWCIQNGECEHCEYRERTDKSDICPIRTDAFNLINRQNAEIERLKYNLKAVLDEIPETKREVAREIFAEIEKIATAEGAYDYVSIQDIAELEKKYTEEKK